MSLLKKVCSAIVQGDEYSCKNHKQRLLYTKCLNVEQRMFELYLRTGRYRKKDFPIESVKSVLYTNKDELEEIVKMFFDSGWKPEIHVILTRKKFEKFTFIGQALTF